MASSSASRPSQHAAAIMRRSSCAGIRSNTSTRKPSKNALRRDGDAMSARNEPVRRRRSGASSCGTRADFSPTATTAAVVTSGLSAAAVSSGAAAATATAAGWCGAHAAGGTDGTRRAGGSGAYRSHHALPNRPSGSYRALAAANAGSCGYAAASSASV
jgi:hypothetical protein